jgi:D-alanyl-D-alanine carboxypeptidase
MKIFRIKALIRPLILIVLAVFLISMIQLPVFADDIWPEPADVSDADGWPNSVEAANNNGSWPDISEIPAKAWIVIDAANGEVIIAKNENEKLYPASTTKIMTALLALSDPDYDPDRVLTASANAVDLSWDSSSIDLLEGETIRMQDALAGLMIASGNDAANVIAENLAGSVEAFALLMNEKARELGATQTSYKNPHGLHDEEHYGTS